MADSLRRPRKAGKPDKRAHPDQAPTCGLCDQPGVAIIGGVDVCTGHRALALEIGKDAGTVAPDGTFVEDGGEQRRRPIVRMAKRRLRG